MRTHLFAVAAWGPTALFVLLWSSGALFAQAGLAHASPFAFLALRFVLACAVLAVLAAARGRWLPRPGQRGLAAATGLILLGGYSICYLLALDAGLSAGGLATLLGVQPILTLLLLERRLAWRRLGGLTLALAGLTLVVVDSLMATRMGWAGAGFGLAALACATAGTLLQKRLDGEPLDLLPLQHGCALLLCGLFLPFQPLRAEFGLGLLVCLVWLGVVISVAATWLLYRLIRSGSLVNVTSLFYLVPPGTALLDWLVLGHAMAAPAWLGLVAILVGLRQVLGTGVRPAP
ncbi:DMT family transporter [Ramlibacter tataouinensis]|nr:DMT family transporter [Ramlibacter tataouinensis]